MFVAWKLCSVSDMKSKVMQAPDMIFRPASKVGCERALRLTAKK